MMMRTGFVTPEQGKQMMEDLQKAKELVKVREEAFRGFDLVKQGNQLTFKFDPRLMYSGAYDSQLNAAIAMLARDAAGRFSEFEAEKLEKQFKPKVTDSPQVIQMKLRSLSKALDMKSDFPILDSWGMGLNPAKMQQSSNRYTPEGQRTLPDLGPIARPAKPSKK
jgi:hypothetical protein